MFPSVREIMTLTIREGSSIGSGRIEKEIKRNNGDGQNRTERNRTEPNDVERNGTELTELGREWNGIKRGGLCARNKRGRDACVLCTRAEALLKVQSAITVSVHCGKQHYV